MAEGILKKKLEDLKFQEITVSSMGIHGLDQQPASTLAQQVCLENGVDISNHRSRPLVPDELMSAKYIFVMELVHKEFIHVFVPKVSDKTFLLGAWPEQANRKAIIKDPIGGPVSAYKKTFVQIESHIQRIFPLIAQGTPKTNQMNKILW